MKKITFITMLFATILSTRAQEFNITITSLDTSKQKTAVKVTNYINAVGYMVDVLSGSKEPDSIQKQAETVTLFVKSVKTEIPKEAYIKILDLRIAKKEEALYQKQVPVIYFQEQIGQYSSGKQKPVEPNGKSLPNTW